MNPVYVCRVCAGSKKLKEFKAREMMFGTREQFLYDECSVCGSLQIASLPDETTLKRHYPSDYYSYVPSLKSRRSFKGVLSEWLSIERNRYILGFVNPVGAVMQRLRPGPPDIASLAEVKARLNDHILDMGCGSAANLLDRMALIGFKNLIGADPFISSDTVSPLGVTVMKKDLGEIEGTFDLIMFHHSFEHVPEPKETLLRVRQLLKTDGRCLIRVPTPSSESFEIYGANWVNLDPPRHLILVSREGMQILAQNCGFVVEKIVDDSSRWQFIASELYLKNIPLVEQKGEALMEFSRKTVKEYDKRAARLNSLHRGDTVAFILKAA